jgi:hypothetical protein
VTEPAATAALVLTCGPLPGVRTAQVVVGGGSPHRISTGQTLSLRLAPGPHEVRVLAGGAQSHLHRVVLEDDEVRELRIGAGWTDDRPDTEAVPALLEQDERLAPIAWRDGTPFESPWPPWLVALGATSPLIGYLVGVGVLRRSRTSETARGLAVTGLVWAATTALALVVGAVWVFAGDA